MAAIITYSAGTKAKASEVNQNCVAAYFQTAGATALTNKGVNVITSATTIVSSNASRKAVIVFNNGAADMFIGGSGTTLTSTNGFKLPAYESIYIYDSDTIVGITSSGTADTRYLEVQ